MMSHERERLPKLPVWAQELIMRQEQKIEELRKQIIDRDHPEGCPTTNAMVECVTGDFARDMSWRPSAHPEVAFEMRDDDHATVRMEVLEDGSRWLKITGCDLIRAAFGNQFYLGRRER